MIPTEEATDQPLTKKRVAILLVALCVLVGAMVGTLGLIPTTTPSDGATASGGSGAATDAPAAAADGSVATSDNSTIAENATTTSDDPAERVSDCDLIDIDGNNNTVSVNIGNNTSADDGVNIHYRCGAGNATVLDHDLIEIDGNNNSVTVVVWAENDTIVFGKGGSATNSNGLHVALQCEGDTPADCDTVDIDGYNNSVTLIVQSDDDRTVHEFGANSSDATRTAGKTGQRTQ